MRWLALLLFLVACGQDPSPVIQAASAPYPAPSSKPDEFWHPDCLKQELAKCPKGHLNLDRKLNEHEKNTLRCRLHALAKCRK